MAVNLDRNDRSGPLGDHRRERAGSRPDFKHDVVRRQLGRVHDHPLQVKIDEKVLPMPRLRPHPRFLEALLQVGEGLVFGGGKHWGRREGEAGG